MTPVRPLGTLHCPQLNWSQPQATTVPSLFRARLCLVPVAIAITPVRSLGTVHCPESAMAQPHATTVPSPFKAKLCTLFAATAVTPERPLGTVHCPKSSPPAQPHTVTVPVAIACAPAGRSSPTLRIASEQIQRGSALALVGV